MSSEPVISDVVSVWEKLSTQGIQLLTYIKSFPLYQYAMAIRGNLLLPDRAKSVLPQGFVNSTVLCQKKVQKQFEHLYSLQNTTLTHCTNILNEPDGQEVDSYYL